jgi:hypothetical protein
MYLQIGRQLPHLIYVRAGEGRGKLLRKMSQSGLFCVVSDPLSASCGNPSPLCPLYNLHFRDGRGSELAVTLF